jgi:hypothetical protein
VDFVGVQLRVETRRYLLRGAFNARLLVFVCQRRIVAVSGEASGCSYYAVAPGAYVEGYEETHVRCKDSTHQDMHRQQVWL